MSKIILNGIEYSNGITYQELQPVIYSDEEREVGVWRGGKPLYQKTIDFGALPNNTTKNVAHGISNLDKIIDFSALAKRPEPFNIIPLPNSHYNSISSQQEISFNATNIIIRNGNNASAYTDVYVTLLYTKTTDTAGSGDWTPSGVPTVHYDGNEKVIGTWFGETLYEKTFHLSNKSISVGKNIIVSASDLSSLTIDKVIGTVNGCITLSGGTYIINIPYGIGATSYVTADYDSAEGIRVWRGGSAFTANDIYLTIQYTKTS